MGRSFQPIENRLYLLETDAALAGIEQEDMVAVEVDLDPLVTDLPLEPHEDGVVLPSLFGLG